MGSMIQAEEMELNTTVPDQHQVTIDSKEGRVVVNGVVCQDSVMIKRHESQSYVILPNKNKEIESVMYNGTDVSDQVVRNRFTAPILVKDSTLVVTYRNQKEDVDDQHYDIDGVVVDEDGNQVPDVEVSIDDKKDVTDKDGSFEIEGIPSGTHQIIITDKDGTILGSIVITIGKADGSKLTLQLDKQGNPNITPAKENDRISMKLKLKKDGSIEMMDVKGSSKETGMLPQTGDQQRRLLYVGLMLCAMIMLLISYKRTKAN